jgi:hypothetical protein
MNIFVLDKNPKKIPRLLHDKHVVKMTLESTQMLCNLFDADIFDVPYKKAYIHHPCSKWVIGKMENYNWLLKHAKALAKEYTHRYYKRHKCEDVIDWCEKNYTNKIFPFPKTNYNKENNRFVTAMPDIYKYKSYENKTDLLKETTAYYRYYKNEKLNNSPKWTNRNIPNRFKSHISEYVYF